MILLIDNYDSFTYNLVQRLGELDPGIELEVYRNDQIGVDEIEQKKPTHIIVSPGPCTPREAGGVERRDPGVWGADSDLGGLSGASVHRSCVRGGGGAGRAGDARQDLADPSRRQGRLSRFGE